MEGREKVASCREVVASCGEGREVVASCGDSLVRESDLQLLEGRQWLNDQIIGFYYELCQHDLFAGHNFAFIGPEVAQLMRLSTREELAACLSTLDLASRAAVFLPVNNSSSLERPGGSHWSLLLHVRGEGAFHLDSSAGTNGAEAKQLLSSLCGLLGAEVRHVTSVYVEQQRNGYDCGVHCILHTENMARHLAAGGKVTDFPALEPDKIASGRIDLAAVIRGVGRK